MNTYRITYGVEVQIEATDEGVLQEYLDDATSLRDDNGPVIPTPGSASYGRRGNVYVTRRETWMLTVEESKT